MSTLGRYEGPTPDECLADWIAANPVDAGKIAADWLFDGGFLITRLQDALFRAMERDHDSRREDAAADRYHDMQDDR